MTLPPDTKGDQMVLAIAFSVIAVLVVALWLSYRYVCLSGPLPPPCSSHHQLNSRRSYTFVARPGFLPRPPRFQKSPPPHTPHESAAATSPVVDLPSNNYGVLEIEPGVDPIVEYALASLSSYYYASHAVLG